MYGDGQGFVPDAINPNASVTIIAQNPGADEEAGRKVDGYLGNYPVYVDAEPQPLIGKTGWQLRNKFLPIAQLTENDVSLCNIIKCRWIKNGKRTNEMPPESTLHVAMAHCTRHYLRIPRATKLIVAMGAKAASFFGIPGTITEWRGFLTPPDYVEGRAGHSDSRYWQ